MIRYRGCPAGDIHRPAVVGADGSRDHAHAAQRGVGSPRSPRSVMFTVGFYIPLKKIMGALQPGMSSYAQYLTPLIVLQAIAFAAVSAAFRSATDSVQGINRRFEPCRSPR